MPTPWTPEKLITQDRAVSVARALFPDEVAAGDCMSELGREGLPCTVCAAARQNWQDRVLKVRRAMFVAFGHTPPELKWESNDA